LLVAISATSSEWNGSERVRLSTNYVRSIEGAGLVPFVVPPLSAPAGALALLEHAGGLLLTGGEDVDPARYGAQPHPATAVPNALRDVTELALLAAAKTLKLPVLAICRGMQLLNVAMGGTLVQDLPSERPSSINHDESSERTERSHSVTLAEGSRVAIATGTREMMVNSYHHQAADRIAPGLRVTATAPDGVIEGLEVDDPEWWVLAVQWHPEDLTLDARTWDRSIFQAFAEQIRRSERR
jgi:putative glutamine amidotransferase